MTIILNIENGEALLSVRQKLNSVIDYINASGDIKVKSFDHVTGLTGGATTDLDYYGTDLQIGTVAIIGAVISAEIAGVTWVLKTSQPRPAAGLTVVHVAGNGNLYWSLVGSGS